MNQPSLLDISMKAQDFAIDAVKHQKNALGKSAKHVSSSVYQTTYMVSLVREAINLYHQALRGIFAEKGLEIPDFMETPLYPSD